MNWLQIIAAVEERAEARCEYCRMHQSLQGATFHVEHIIPGARGGPSELSNLALACPGCNLKKSDRTEVIDPVTKQMVRLYNPDHFTWEQFQLVPLTEIGRAMIAAFDLNNPRRQRIRQAERLFGLF